MQIKSIVTLIGLFLFSKNTYCNENYQDINFNKQNQEIYTIKNNKKYSFTFIPEDFMLSSRFFSHFNNQPSIEFITDTSDNHITLKFNGNNFYVDCVYTDFRRRQNGMSGKVGICNLNKIILKNYNEIEDYITQVIEDISAKFDTVNTLGLINKQLRYLPVILFRNDNQYIYQVINNLKDLENKNYQLMAKDEKTCHQYSNNTWLIYYKNNPKKIEIKSEKISQERIILTEATPKTGVNACNYYPILQVKTDKSYFLDKENHPKRSYLIKHDQITLVDIDEQHKYCEVRYHNPQNKVFDGKILCSTINAFY